MTESEENGEDGLSDWPPPGFTSWYTVSEQLDGQPERTFDVVVPSTFSNVDLSTVRVGRHGGANNEDREFRRALYGRIGAVVVASGHVEAAMKRLLLLLDEAPEAQFSLVDLNWTKLHELLRGHASESTERSQELCRILDWGEDNQVKQRRDNVVHAFWWNYAGLGARRSRFYRRSDGATINATLDDLTEDADLLFEYAEKLDVLLGSDWIIARLPRSSDHD